MSQFRASKPSSIRRHNTLRDCCSQDPTVTDTVLAKDRVRSKRVQTQELETGTLTSSSQTTLNDLEIKGQTRFPDDFHKQLSDHFQESGHALRVPRMVTDSATVQGMLSVRNNTSVKMLSADGPIDARGDINCFGTAHFYGPIKIHGSFEVDQTATTRMPPSLLEYCTEVDMVPEVPEKKDPATQPAQVPPPPLRKLETPMPVPTTTIVPVHTFQCKTLQADHVKTKDSVDAKQIQTQRLFAHSAETKDLVTQSVQTQSLIVEDGLRTGHLQSVSALVQSLDVETKLQAQTIQVGQTLQSHAIDTTVLKSKHVNTETAHCTKTTTKQLETKEAQIDALQVRKSLDVTGTTTFHDNVLVGGAITAKDKVIVDSVFCLTDRITSEVGRPIEMKQVVDFKRPICLSNYQYFIFNTQQTSVSKPYQIVMADSTQTLIIDSDLMNVLSLAVKLPSNPAAGQLAQITTNPSISTVVITASCPIVSQPTTMSMGSFVQFMFVHECKKWFRTG